MVNEKQWVYWSIAWEATRKKNEVENERSRRKQEIKSMKQKSEGEKEKLDYHRKHHLEVIYTKRAILFIGLSRSIEPNNKYENLHFQI